MMFQRKDQRSSSQKRRAETPILPIVPKREMESPPSPSPVNIPSPITTVPLARIAPNIPILSMETLKQFDPSCQDSPQVRLYSPVAPLPPPYVNPVYTETPITPKHNRHRFTFGKTVISLPKLNILKRLKEFRKSSPLLYYALLLVFVSLCAPFLLPTFAGLLGFAL